MVIVNRQITSVLQYVNTMCGTRIPKNSFTSLTFCWQKQAEISSIMTCNILIVDLLNNRVEQFSVLLGVAKVSTNSIKRVPLGLSTKKLVMDILDML